MQSLSTVHCSEPGSALSGQLEDHLELMVIVCQFMFCCIFRSVFIAVAILAILRSESNAFPPSTVIIEQYRPPVDSYVIGEREVP